MELWGTTVQAHTGHPASWYEFFESVAPTFGVYNWGINPEQNYGASVANGGTMNSDEAKAALEWWIGNLEYAPPESTQSTWDEVAATLRRRPRRAGPGLWRERRLDRHQRRQVAGRRQGRRDAAAAGRRRRHGGGRSPAQGYIGYYDGGAFGIPTSSKNKEAALLFLQYIGQASVQADWAAAGSRIVMSVHLRRSEDQGAGYQSRRLLHADEGSGKALRGRARLSRSTRRCARRPRRSSTRRSPASSPLRTRSTRWPQRPRQELHEARLSQIRLNSIGAGARAGPGPASTTGRATRPLPPGGFGVARQA